MRISTGNCFICVVAGIVCTAALLCVPARAQTSVSLDHDIRFDEMMLPVLWDGSDSTMYSGLDVDIPVKARFFNAGTKTENNVPVKVTVRTSSGAAMLTLNGNIAGEWEPGTYREFESVFGFSHTMAHKFGYYSIYVCADLGNDMLRDNDCNPPRVFAWNASTYEIKAANPQGANTSPLPDRTYLPGDSIIPHATYLNVGTEIITGAAARMIIQGPSGRIIYDDTTSIPPIDTVRRLRRADFPTPLLLNDGYGTYRATAIGSHRSDPLKKDDTAFWTFRVGTIAGLDRVEGTGAASASALSVHPNPADEYAQATYMAPPGTAATLRLYGPDGREVPHPAGYPLSREGTITLSTRSLASGLYTLALVFPDGSMRSAQVLVRH